MDSNKEKKRTASSPAQDNHGKRMDEKDTPTTPPVGLFGYLFSGGTQKNAVEKSPVAKLAAESRGHVDINSDGFERAYNEESSDNLNRWSPTKTANLIKAERQKQKTCQVANLGYTEPIFKVNNVGAMREELEIEIETLNGNFQGHYYRT